MYQYQASLNRVIDGDTMEFVVDLGFGIYSVHAVRLHGINSPEVVGPTRADGLAAAAWSQQWFRDNPGPYVLETYKGRETEKYGRYLGTVTALNGRVINSDIVAAGHAVVYLP